MGNQSEEHNIFELLNDVSLKLWTKWGINSLQILAAQQCTLKFQQAGDEWLSPLCDNRIYVFGCDFVSYW